MMSFYDTKIVNRAELKISSFINTNLILSLFSTEKSVETL